MPVRVGGVEGTNRHEGSRMPWTVSGPCREGCAGQLDGAWSRGTLHHTVIGSRTCRTGAWHNQNTEMCDCAPACRLCTRLEIERG